MRRRTAPAREQEHTSDALAELLQAESRLAARLDAARDAAAETLRHAREEAQCVEDACGTTIAARTTTLTSEYEARLEAGLADIRREAQRMVARFEAVDDARIRDYVALMIGRLLTPDEAAEPR